MYEYLTGILHSPVPNLGLSSEDDFIDDHSSSVLQPMETLYQGMHKPLNSVILTKKEF